MADTATIGDQIERPPSDGGPSSLDQAVESAKTAAQTTTGETKAVLSEAKGTARDLMGDGRAQLRHQADEQAQRLAGTLRGFSTQLSSMSGAPRAEGTAAEMARQAASRVADVARRIEQGGIDGVTADAKRLARNRPGAFLLGALGAGFVVGRVIKHADTHALTSAATPSSESDPHRGDGEGGDSHDHMVSLGQSARPSTPTVPPEAAGDPGFAPTPGLTGLDIDRSLGGADAGAV